jgi:hypothetical protein
MYCTIGGSSNNTSMSMTPWYNVQVDPAEQTVVDRDDSVPPRHTNIPSLYVFDVVLLPLTRMYQVELEHPRRIVAERPR